MTSWPTSRMPSTPPDVRRGGPADAGALADVFWRGVHESAAPRYDAAQRAAWLQERPGAAAFAARLDGQRVWVAERDGAARGFATLWPDGYLDFLYVLAEARGDGTAAALLAAVEAHARTAGLARLTARASDMARPLLLRRGWTVVGDAAQRRDGVTIPATDMARRLL